MKKSSLDSWISRKIGFYEGHDGSYTNDLDFRTALENYQLEKLKESIRTAKKARFYYQLYGSIDENRFTSLKDITQLPLMDKTDIFREEMQLLAVHPGNVCRTVSIDTSGTTKRKKRIYFTETDQELTVDFFHEGMKTLVRPSDTHLILLPVKTPGCVGDLLGQGLIRLGAKVVAYGPYDDFDDVLKAITDHGVNGITGSPTQIMALLRYTEAAGLRMDIKSVLVSTDYVPDVLRCEVKRVWGAAVFEHYGMTEMGLGCAVSCEAGLGYHIRENDLYIEIIDKHGQTVEDGIFGEIVFTTLTRNGMPLIRYKTGDRGRILDENCPCGSVIKRLDKVSSRLNDKVLIGGQYFYIRDITETVLSVKDVYDYDCFVENKKGEKIVLRLICKSHTTDADKLKMCKEEIKRRFRCESRFAEMIEKGILEVCPEAVTGVTFGIEMISKKSFSSCM